MCGTGCIIRIISGIAGDTVGKILRCQFEDKWGNRGLNGIIHHCLDLKSQILRIYLPGNDTPTTDKGYKQEILEWAQRTRGFTCLRARVLWLCVNSREENFYEGFFLNNDVCHFLPLIEVFESSWSNMVFDPLHCYVLEN